MHLFKLKNTVLLLSALLLSGALAAQKVRVLMVGNSYTFYHKMPETLQKLATAAGDTLEVTALTKGGQKLALHLLDSSVMNTVLNREYDILILQEYSLYPVLSELRESEMWPAIRTFHGIANLKKAQTMLYMPWARKNGGKHCIRLREKEYCTEAFADYYVMQDSISKAYLEIAKELDLLVAPAGPAWRNARDADSTLELWDKDLSHPNKKGAYLNACVLYATLFNKSPIGIGYYASLTEKEAVKLQKIASATVLNNKSWDFSQKETE